MNLSAETTLTSRTIDENGTISCLFKTIVMNGDKKISSENHRVPFAPGDDIDSVVVTVNADLDARSLPLLASEDIEAIKATAALEWTASVVAAFKAGQA